MYPENVLFWGTGTFVRLLGDGLSISSTLLYIGQIPRSKTANVIGYTQEKTYLLPTNCPCYT